MVEAHVGPRACDVAILALRRGFQMVRRHAGGCSVVVARGATASNPGMVEMDLRPACDHVAIFTCV